MKNLFLFSILLLSLISCQIDSLSDFISTNDDTENTDDPTNTTENDFKSVCTLTTACEVVVFEDTSNLSVKSIQSGDGFLITVQNEEGDILYEKECTEGASVSMACTSSSGENTDEGEDSLDGNGEENDQSKKTCTLTTDCEVVVFEGTSNLSVKSIQSGDGFLITVQNEDGDILYEKVCTEGASVSMACTSSSGENTDEGEDNSDENGEEDDQSKKSCTLTTDCEVVVFEDTSSLSVKSIQSGDGFLITVQNEDGDILYEKVCTEGASASMACTSSSGENTDEGEDNSDGDDEEDDQSKKSCTLTTDCEVVVFEGTSSLSVKSIQSGDGFLITVKNEDEEIIYEKECLEGGLARLTCSSRS